MITGTGEVTTSQADLAQQLIEAAKPAVMRRIDEMGRACVQEIASEAGAIYRNARPPQRSRSSPRLSDASAYDYDVLPSPKGGRLEVFVAAGEDFKAKFFSLNNGSAPHTIRARNAKRLGYNRDDPASTDYNFFPKERRHPGTSGSRFYERAIQRALARFRR